MHLAILVLVVVGIYFLSMFGQQSLNLYRLKQQERAEEIEVREREEENERLQRDLARLLGEEGRRMAVKQNLPYKDPDEHVAIPVASEGAGHAAPEEVEAGLSPEELAALPVWQQWWQVVFTPAGP